MGTTTAPAKTHTPECAITAYKAFYAQHPGACKKCNATGIIYYTENMSPLGSGENWPMDMTDVCSECVSNGCCPRCHATLVDQDGQPLNDECESVKCPECGWEENGKYEPAPENWCTCRNVYKEYIDIYGDDLGD